MKGNKHIKIITRLLYLAFAVVGLAAGAVTAQGALGDLFASINGTGDNGGGFIYQYTPDGMHTTFGSGLSQPRGMAFDGAGNQPLHYLPDGRCSVDFENYPRRCPRSLFQHDKQLLF